MSQDEPKKMSLKTKKTLYISLGVGLLFIAAGLALRNFSGANITPPNTEKPFSWPPSGSFSSLPAASQNNRIRSFVIFQPGASISLKYRLDPRVHGPSRLTGDGVFAAQAQIPPVWSGCS
jgi:hypothetical protein